MLDDLRMERREICDIGKGNGSNGHKHQAAGILEAVPEAAVHGGNGFAHQAAGILQAVTEAAAHGGNGTAHQAAGVLHALAEAAAHGHNGAMHGPAELLDAATDPSVSRIAEAVNRAATLTPRDRQRLLAEEAGMPFVDIEDFALDDALIGTVPPDVLTQHRVLPLTLKGSTLTLAITDPAKEDAIDAVRYYSGYNVYPVVVEPGKLVEILKSRFGLGVEEATDHLKKAMKEAGTAPKAMNMPLHAGDVDDVLRVGADEPAIVRIVSLMIAAGIHGGASDIHVQPEEEWVRVRYRVDGVLEDAPPHRWVYGRAILARIKVLARMDIAEKRKPQDGRISFKDGGTRYDLRVSSLPTVHGEKIVMRIAEHGAREVGLDELGFSLDQLERFESLVTRPYGMILVTGPTGSGKTTTLYSVLSRLHDPQKNIITVEDPVERRIAGINQAEVNSTDRAPVTFATALRSILRQDPNIIMVGEIRDRDTAEIGINAALTGHLVLSTLHTNDAAGAAPRLLDMGVAPFLVSSAVIGVLAQRLVRTLCPKCKESYAVSTASLRSLRVPTEHLPDEVTLYRPKGCPECHGHGFKGRLGVFELLLMSDEVRRLILDRAPGVEIARVAHQQGMVTMIEDAFSKIVNGITSLQEALRVVDAG